MKPHQMTQMAEMILLNVICAQLVASRHAINKFRIQICVICVMCGFMYLRPLAAQTCGSHAECRQMAEEAAAREDFEAFHTLAWRVVQTGPANDPKSLYLLARAQSLSGRALDALVMLRRLADLKFAAIDAETSEEFRRVRSLAGWPDVLAKIYAAAGRPAPPSVASNVSPDKPLEATPKSAAPEPKNPGTLEPKNPGTAKSRNPGTSKPRNLGSRKDAAAELERTEFAFPAALPIPAALAYDSVSRRFIVSDESSDTLKVVDETSLKATNLVSPRWAGPHRPTALAIDARRGDLWVTGTHADANGVARSAVHRLQLVSGRTLYSLSLSAEAGAARFVGVALVGTEVYVLDAHSRRIFEAPPATKSLRVQMALEGEGDLTSLTASDSGDLYVADAVGVLRINPTTRTSARLPAADLDLRGLQWVGYHNGSLLGIQRKGDGRLTAVRIELNENGSSAKALEVLGDAASRAATIAGKVFYFVAANSQASGPLVQRVILR